METEQENNWNAESPLPSEAVGASALETQLSTMQMESVLPNVKSDPSEEDNSLSPNSDESGKTGGWGDQIPNVLTILRIALVPLLAGFLIASYYSQYGWYYLVVATVIFCLAALTDHLDGLLARKWKLVSRFGKIADPIADKALMLVAFLGLSFFYGLYWWFTVIVIIREVAVTWLRMQLLKQDIVVPASMGGKIKTVLQMLTVFLWMIMLLFITADSVFLVILIWLVMLSLVSAFVATVLSGVVYYLDARDQGFILKSRGETVKQEDTSSLAEEESAAGEETCLVDSDIVPTSVIRVEKPEDNTTFSATSNDLKG